ncbi:hypothetical protein DJ568_09090 [Mucilaginibacter hurinus]|uniref:Single-stranded DNA-binding protein n=1 Tax=Mucilaginibacter hurinus TaxID=2201324 RepID=A0A367GQG8_9SPHI|nr:single-stranded DNA-binding protein [Mucilaginibacter hurinus]RCH55325.1 hypothetical protein DJ568_09090 [Mucilaginibacter hurinus]
MLDGINGGEIRAHIKNDNTTCNLPVVIVSAYGKMIQSLGTYANTGLNKAFLIGHIDRELRWHFSSDKKKQLCFISRTTEIINAAKGDMEHVEYHHIKVNDDNECLNRLKLNKGQLLYIQGKVQTHSFVDAKIKRYKTEILALQLVDIIAPVPVATVSVLP